MSDVLAVVSALSSARKATQLYPPTHPNHQSAIADLVNHANACLIEGPFALNLHQGRLYAGSTVLAEEAPGIMSMADSFESHRIESLTFHPGFGESDALALVETLALRPSASLDVAAELESREVATVTVSKIVDEDEEEREERERLREQDRILYKRLVAILRSVVSRIQQSGHIDLGETQGIVQNIMGRLLDDEAAVLGMAAMRGRDDRTLFHSINVMIYSLSLAAGLGIPEEGLASLGVSALLHDVGKAPYDLNDPVQAEAARTDHPTIGAEILARLPLEDKTPMLVAYEHHMGVDGSGFPEHESDYFAHPYSRMVAIADRYENLTAGSTSTEPMTPDRAILQLLRESSTTLDPMLTRVFVKALGVFPIGCMLRLDDHSVGVVCRAGSEMLKPIVRVVYGPDGLVLEHPEEIDLAEGVRQVVEVVSEESLAIEAADHL